MSGVSNPMTTKEQVGGITAKLNFHSFNTTILFSVFFYAINCFLRTIFHKGAIYRINQVKRLLHNIYTYFHYMALIHLPVFQNTL